MGKANGDWNDPSTPGSASGSIADDLAALVADSVEVLAIAAEESVGQSRASAARIRERTYDVPELIADVVETGGRAAGVWRDVARIWLAGHRRAPERQARQDRRRESDGPPDGGAGAAGIRVAVDVAGAQGATGTAFLSVDPGLQRMRAPARVSALRSIEGDGAAINGARLVAAADTGAPTVMVHVPAGLPPGRYVGSILGGDELLGSIMLVIPAEGGAAPGEKQA